MRKCGSVQVCLCTGKMKVTLQLCVFMLLVHASLAVWQNKTVLKGRTLELSCPIKPQFQGHPVEWKNPDGNIMFFDSYEGVKDKRYSLVRRSESESIIQISDVTFSDGGIYTCTHYLQQAEVKTVRVTVLAQPKVEYITHQGKAFVKCTAEGNNPLPEISWQFMKGPEFQTHMEITQEHKRFVAVEMITILTEKATRVKCLVRHPAWHSNPLMNFVTIRRNGKIKPPRTTTSLPETTPALKTTREITPDQFSTIEKESSEFSTTVDFSTRGSTRRPRTTTETTREITTDRFSTTEKENSELSTTANFNTRDAKYTATTSLPLNTSQSNSSDGSTVALPDSTTQNQTSRSWNTTDLTTTQTDISFNETKRNSTDNGHDVEKQTVNEGNASALIFLVTCLIVGLVVVLIFIFIKLRRAHIAWKRENDDSNQTSETSGKSKSSQEDKNGQKRRGFFNTGATHYVVQEPAVITSVTNPHAMTAPEDTAKTEEIAPVPPPPQTTAKSKVKETEL